jgi:glutamyl-tRNA synthetase
MDLLQPKTYRGRLAPSPTGYLHLGHARTFWIAQLRAHQHEHGTLVLRNEDLDSSRCRSEYVQAIIDDLRWFGLDWQEGPDVGGAYGPYTQSERSLLYRSAWQRLYEGGFIFPCSCSRKDVAQAAQAPHPGNDESIYPGTCRGLRHAPDACPWPLIAAPTAKDSSRPPRFNWRFRIPDGEVVVFDDGCQGRQQFIAGGDFGDFVVWRHDNTPSYQLAVVVDDAAMEITEVVRGCDLLCSTARQLLLYRALKLIPPRFYHCPLVVDRQGNRLSKRCDAAGLRQLKAHGYSPDALRDVWNQPANYHFAP